MAMPGSTSAAAASAMASFSACWSDDLAAKPGSNRALPGDGGRAAVDLLEDALVVEDLEVAPDGHVRHAELADEVGDADGALLPDPVEDDRLALTREHPVPLATRDGVAPVAGRGLDPLDRRDCRPSQRKSTSVRGIVSVQVRKRRETIDIVGRGVGTIRLNLSDYVGAFRRSRPMADPTERLPVTRRTVLKGIAGTAGLLSVPAIVAACSTPSGGSAAPSAAASAAPQHRRAASSAPPATGSTSLGSNYSDEVPKTAMQAVVDAFTAETGIAVTVNTVDHNTFQDQISSYLQGTPDDTFTWFAGYRMRFFADQGLAGDLERRVGDDLERTTPRRSRPPRPATTASSTSSRSTTTRGSSSTEEPVRGEGLHRPHDVGRVHRPGRQDEDRRPRADGLRATATAGRRWAPSTSSNMRLNGYEFHIGLMAGTNKWTDPKTKAVFEKWRELIPYLQEGALGRTWQDGAQSMLNGEAGMYFLGTFAGEQAADRTPGPTSASSRSRPSAPSSTPSSASTPRSTAS